MRKLFVLSAFFANLILLLACSQQLQLSEENLIGTWKHPIQAGSITENGEETPVYNNEILQFKEDGTFVFGEYGSSPLYEVEGHWKLSDDKTRLEFSFDGGETSSIDIREFDGISFITTSREGNDFKYTRE